MTAFIVGYIQLTVSQAGAKYLKKGLIVMSEYRCSRCGVALEASEAYEYRGAFACEDHFDETIEMRDFERGQIISEEHRKTKAFKGLDLSDSVIGKANKKLLKQKMEITGKESARLKQYERGV